MGWCETIIVTFHCTSYDGVAKIAQELLAARKARLPEEDYFNGQVFLMWLAAKRGDVAEANGHGHDGVVTWAGCFDKHNVERFIEELEPFWLAVLAPEDADRSTPRTRLRGLHSNGRVLVISEHEQYSQTRIFAIDLKVRPHPAGGEPERHLEAVEYMATPAVSEWGKGGGLERGERGTRCLFDFDGERRW